MIHAEEKMNEVEFYQVFIEFVGKKGSDKQKTKVTWTIKLYICIMPSGYYFNFTP